MNWACCKHDRRMCRIAFLPFLFKVRFAMKTSCRSFVIALLLGSCLASVSAAERVLFDFTQPCDLSKIATTDAKRTTPESTKRTGLLVLTEHHQPWPGITLVAPQGHWDLSPYAQVLARLKNPGTNTVTVFCRVDNPGAGGTQH